MSFLENIKDEIAEFKYARFFSVFASIFALIYHFSFLFVFRALGVLQMFYFNIFSVSLFSILTILIIKKDNLVQIFPIFYSEVVVHQILADYYLGGTTCFHFFILLIGILPILTFKQHYFRSIVYGLISVLIFAGLEVVSTEVIPIYEISHTTERIIKSVNLGLTVFVDMGALFFYSFILWQKEYSLKAKVQRQEVMAMMQNRKIMVMQNNIISSLASLVENRDTDTGEHIQRTSGYVELIAKQALKEGVYSDEITKDFISLAKRAAPLHDVGKIMVSDTILKKPGKLTPEEFEMIKLHAKEGGRIINEVVGISEDKEFVKIAGDIATYHHERWDGKGYPSGKKGQEIPVSARIMAVADVFDALVSNRCYKKAMSSEEAFKIIKEDAGSHFDPVLVDLFLSVQDEVLDIMKKYSR